jgi:hypothetical protein
LLKQVAAGELSVTKALRRVDPPFGGRKANSEPFRLHQAEHRLRELVIREFSAAEQAARFVNWTGELERAMRFAT